MEQNISDYDGITPTTMKCKICRLNIPDEYMIGEVCKANHNYKLIFSLAKLGQQIFKYAIVFILMSFVLPLFGGTFVDLKKYNLYVIIVAFLPIMLISQVQLKIHYRGIPEKFRIIHQLRYYNIKKESRYYDAAIALVIKYKDEITEEHKLRILNELVESVMMGHKFNPPMMMEEWASSFSMTEEEFVRYLFENTDILNGLGAIGGSGLLPDIMSYVTNQDIKEKIYDKLLESCNSLEVASDNEKLYFQQDLFLVIEDIREDLEKNSKWSLVIEIADSYEADTPPKNSREAIAKQFEAMSAQQQTQQ